MTGGASGRQGPEQHAGRRRRGAPRPSLLQRIRNNFLTGMVVVAPFAITMYLTWTIIDFVDSTVLPNVIPLIPEAYRPENLLPFYLPGLGLVVFAIFLVFVGSFTKNFFGREILRIGERWVDRMPVVRSLYNALKQIAETIFTQSSNSFDKACLVEYPRKGIWAVAFVSTDTKGEIPKKAHGGRAMVSVFLPTTPNPTSGFLLFVPREDVVILDMSVEEAAKLVISAGLVTPQDLRGSDEPPASQTTDADVRATTAETPTDPRRPTAEDASPAGAGEAAARNPLRAI